MPEVWIELLPDSSRPMVCSGSGQSTQPLHDVSERWVRDPPILDAQAHLLVHRRRVLCPRCGPKLEALSWLGRYDRVTKRLAQSVARLCAVLPVKHVAEFYDLDRKTVKMTLPWHDTMSCRASPLVCGRPDVASPLVAADQVGHHPTEPTLYLPRQSYHNALHGRSFLRPGVPARLLTSWERPS